MKDCRPLCILRGMWPIISIVVWATLTGCTTQHNRVIEPLDLRATDTPQPIGKSPVRVVLGMGDCEGDFSERFSTFKTILPTEDRKRWRDMGLKAFPDCVAQYLQQRKTFLDVKRQNLETADLILNMRLKEFRRDWGYETLMIPIYALAINAHKWTITSEINAECRLLDPRGRALATFNIHKLLPPVDLTRGQLGMGWSATALVMPPEVEEEFGQTARQFLSEILTTIEAEILANRQAYTYLERPDLDQAQNLSDQLFTGKPRNQWAVIVGISRYQRGGTQFPDLQFADRDANDFCQFLMSPTGGGFKKDHILLLTNQDATYSAIRNSLFTFLKDAEENDLAIVFFSGHGAPDPARPENLYLLPHDVDPGDIAATGFPMWDMEKVLWQIIKAQRVVVFADACHSAGVAAGVGTKGVGAEAAGENIYGRYFRRLAHTKPGRVVLSSSGGNEQSLEGRKWDRHGVFTWALLKGLKGAADGIIPATQKDGIITLQEATTYVQQQVAAETQNKQRPFLAASPKYDADLPLGVVPEVSGQ